MWMIHTWCTSNQIFYTCGEIFDNPNFLKYDKQKKIAM